MSSGAKKTSKPSIDATTRDRLLRVSAKLFASKGYDRVSVRDIARASKCNLSMISYYFGGKEKLYLALFEGFFSRVDQHMQGLEAKTDNFKTVPSREEFIEEIRANIRFFIQEFHTDPNAKIVIHRESMDGFPRARAAFEKHFDLVRERIARFYARAQKSGCIKKTIHIPTFIVLLNRAIESYLVAHMFSKPLAQISIDPLKDTDTFVAQVEEIFLKGVLS
ncbi:MAG TPA: TetR family transcriptional regulator [Bdellovibrionota bacterium]|jgi:AcrR family transcriptional regulator|nr:TetR family transcriptional regulator [Bdellovibrionota bacterium]